jgi:hypothetical protein
MIRGAWVNSTYLVSYVSQALIGYATQAYVQSYVANQLLSYTPLTYVPSYSAINCIGRSGAGYSFPGGTVITVYVTHSRGLTMILISSVLWTAVGGLIQIYFPDGMFSYFDKLGDFAGVYNLQDSTSGISVITPWKWHSSSGIFGFQNFIELWVSPLSNNSAAGHGYGFDAFTITYQSTI